MFLAALDYERIYTVTMALPVKTIDPSTPAVSGGEGNDTVDAVRAASDKFSGFYTRLARRYGAEGVKLVRDCLGRGLTVEMASKERGDLDKWRRAWWGGMLRKVLMALAEISGYAVRGAYDNRAGEAERRERQRKNAERKDREHAKKRKKQKR